LPTSRDADSVAGKLIAPALGAAVNLVASVWTILFAIAVPGSGNTVPGGTAELTGITAYIGAVGAVQLIRAIWTVGISVTAPAGHDAHRAVAAMYEGHIAHLTGSGSTRLFVAEVATVLHVVAEELARNALAASAAELIRLALAEQGGLIAAIATLLLSVALVLLGNASVVLAHKVRLRALAEDAVAAPLVRSVRAVRHVVAGELHGYAFPRVAIVLQGAAARIHGSNATSTVGCQDAPGAMTGSLAALVQDAHILALTIQDLALISIAVDAAVLNRHNAHRPGHMLPQEEHIRACIFVSSNNGMEHPVCPEEQVPVHSHGEGVLGRGVGQHHSIGAIVIGPLDLV